MDNRSLIFEVWQFIKVNKKWWLIPTLIMLLIAGVFIIVGYASSTGGLSPFIYALF